MTMTTTRPTAARVIEGWAHPLILGAAVALLVAGDYADWTFPIALAGVLVIAWVLERIAPAHPEWRQSAREQWVLIAIFIAGLLVFGLIQALYQAVLAPPLVQLRTALGLELWPKQWPVLAQAVLLYFASDLIYYWIHRAIHRWGWFWRLSGHGFHHAFQNLHALNAGATHPLEFLFLALPMVLLGALFGGDAQALSTTAVLMIVNASLAHANVRMDTPALRWLITNSAQHVRHHSLVFEESNTNYSCNAIVWDRLFGTFSRGAVVQTGIGPQEPGLVQKLLLPLREPVYADTAATRTHRSAERV